MGRVYIKTQTSGTVRQNCRSGKENKVGIWEEEEKPSFLRESSVSRNKKEYYFPTMSPSCLIRLPIKDPEKAFFAATPSHSFSPQFLIIPRLLFRLVSGKSRLAIKAAEFFKVPLFFSVSFGASIWEMEPKRRKRCAITPSLLSPLSCLQFSFSTTFFSPNLFRIF